MVENNKDLLDLEADPASSSSTLESKLFVCNKDGHAPPFQKPTMSPLPKSQVLGKVKDFLGVFSESNKKLMEDAKERPESYDIEVLSGNESKYIEMDLMLGIADLHTPEAVAAAECAMAGYQKPNHLGSDEDSSDDDDENQKQSEHGLKAAQRDSSCQDSKKQKPKKKPKIVEFIMAPAENSINPRDVCIVGVARTPMGGFLGSLSSVPATKLGSVAIQSALKRANIDPSLVQEVFFGKLPSANLGQAPARQAALGAGIPNSVVCTTTKSVPLE